MPVEKGTDPRTKKDTNIETFLEANKEHCLCKSCFRKDEHPQPYAGCPAAREMYKTCEDHGVAMLIRRCPEYRPGGKA